MRNAGTAIEIYATAVNAPDARNSTDAVPVSTSDAQTNSTDRIRTAPTIISGHWMRAATFASAPRSVCIEGSDPRRLAGLVSVSPARADRSLAG
jgi:hypothetical protein